MSDAVQEPLVSVCVPTVNRAEYLRQCLTSVLGQDYRRLEIVVCDNASNDHTAAVIDEFAARCGAARLVYHRNESNVGMVPNWNKALALATGEFAIVVSDDDVLQPDAISRLVRTIEQSQSEFAYSPVRFIDSEGREGASTHPGPPLESTSSFVRNTLALLREPYPSALLFRRKSAGVVGGFPNIKNKSDVAFRLALATNAKIGTVACCPAPLVFYRVHPSSLTANRHLANISALFFIGWAAQHFAGERKNLETILYQFVHLRERLGSNVDPTVQAICGEQTMAVEKLVRGSPDVGGSRRWRWFLSSNRGRLALLLCFPLLTLKRVREKILASKFHKRTGSFSSHGHRASA